MRLLCAITMILFGCRSEPPALCATDAIKLRPPWSKLAVPSGGRICAGTDSKQHSGNRLEIQHRRSDEEDVPQLRDRYVAAFRAAGWSTIKVADDAPSWFAADLSLPDGSRMIALSIGRRGDVVEVSAHRAGQGWPKAPPEVGSVEYYAEQYKETRDRAIREQVERHNAKQR